MNLWEALGPGITSQRPQQRSALPRALFVGSDAAPQLAALMREETAGTRAAMVFDTRTGAAAGEACGGALREAGFDVHEVLLPDHDGHSPVCDDTTQDWLREAVPEVDTLVGGGRGVLRDRDRRTDPPLRLGARRLPARAARRRARRGGLDRDRSNLPDEPRRSERRRPHGDPALRGCVS